MLNNNDIQAIIIALGVAVHECQLDEDTADNIKVKLEAMMLEDNV
jgi:hypothetical protein